MKRRLQRYSSPATLKSIKVYACPQQTLTQKAEDGSEKAERAMNGKKGGTFLTDE
jgi:hypothetical protein